MELSISEELNLIVKYAREEAMRTGSYGIGTDHLMLGILRHGENGACKVLRSLGVSDADVKNYLDSRIFRQGPIPYSEMEQVVLARSAQSTLNLTLLEATRFRHSEADSLHLLLAISHTGENHTQELLRNLGITYAVIVGCIREQHLFDGRGQVSEGPSEEEQEEFDRAVEKAADDVEEKRPDEIEDFGMDLTKAAAAGALDPVVGRDDEIGRIVEILGRRKKNNPMLIGEPGVGKSAVVEGLALRIAAGNVPSALKGKRIFSLDIGSVVAGTRYRGDFEKRIKGIISILKANPDIILFIDEFHTVVGAGGAQGSLDAAGMLKPALARGEIQCIGATTLDEFTKIIEKDGALDRRFQKVLVEAPDIGKSIEILTCLKDNYEQFHGVVFTPEAIEACVRLTDRYISERSLPDKAIDALDEAGSMVRLRQGKGAATGFVDADDVARVISRMTGIPVSRVAQSEGQRLLGMKEALCGKVIGQDEAVDTIVRAIRRNRAGLKDPGKPVGTFLFFGPTGVGKTRLAKCLAEYLFDSADNIVRIDMSEYSEKFTSSRLVGAPPGYVGHDEGGQLSEKVRRKPYCVVLLDEIEKAHPDIFNLLLQVLDEGRLTDSSGRTVNFKNTILIMTSNVGSRELEEYGSGVGFARAGQDVARDRQGVLEKAVKKMFPPEFINRVDEKVYFNSLTREDMEKITELEIEALKTRVEDAGFRLRVSEKAKELVSNAGYDPSFGARPLKRAVTRYIEDPVSEFIISDRISRTPDAASCGVATLNVDVTKDGSATKVTKRASRR